MTTCPYCQVELGIGYPYNFCQKCYKQVRCRECTEFLEKDSPVCLYCGAITKIVATNVVVMNRISLKERTKGNDYSREVVAEFSNDAAAAAASNLATLFGQKPPAPNYRTPPSPPELQTPPSPALSDSLGPDSKVVDSQTSEEANRPTVVLGNAGSSITEPEKAISRLFAVQEDKLVATTSNFNGAHAKETELRFMLLYIYAHELLLQRPAERNLMREVMQKRSIWDETNTRNYFRLLKKEFIYGDDNSLRLNHDGHMKAQQVLDAVLNPSEENRALFDVRPRKPRKRKSQSSAQNDTKS